MSKYLALYISRTLEVGHVTRFATYIGRLATAKCSLLEHSFHWHGCESELCLNRNKYLIWHLLVPHK